MQMNQRTEQRKVLCKKFMGATKDVQQLSSEKDCKEKDTEEEEILPLKNNQLQRSQSAPAIFSSKKQWQVSQVVKHEGGDHTFRNVLLFLIMATFIIFAVDLYKEMHQERHELELKRKKCHNQYIENQCETPFEAIKDRCHELQICFHKDPQMTLRTSQIAGKLIGRIIGSFLKETSVWGAIFLLLVLGVFLFFIWGHSRNMATQQTILKNR